jgi:hypothetical protein
MAHVTLPADHAPSDLALARAIAARLMLEELHVFRPPERSPQQPPALPRRGAVSWLLATLAARLERR